MNKTIKKVGIILILFLAIQLIIQVVCCVIGSLPIIQDAIKNHPNEVVSVFQHNATTETLALPLCISTIISSALTILLFWKYKYIPFNFKNFRTEVSYKTLLICVPLTLCAMFFLNTLTEMFPLPDNHQQTFLAMSRTGIWGFLSIAVFAPACEEFVFRGAVEGTLLKTTSPWAAILISALLFGIIHMNPIQIPFAFIIGILLGWLFYKTGSLIPGILAHFINNAIGFMTMVTVNDSNITTEKLLGKPLTYSLMAVSVILFVILVIGLNKTIGNSNKENLAKILKTIQ